MVSNSGRRSFFLLHTFFAVIFVTALFFASLLASSEYAARRIPEKPLPPLHAPSRFSVQSSTQFPRENGPSVSLIVDDVGENLDLLQQLLNLQIPVTVSVLPGTGFDRESAQWARDHGFQVMVHLPMEPDAFPEKDPGSNALLMSMNRRQLVDRTAELIERVPYAVGVNNHMGSRLTSKRAAMNVVLNVVAREGMFFIDSRTSPLTVAFQVARQKHIPSAERSLFLDDPQDTENVRLRFEELIALARTNGSAVGICHLKPQTIAILQSLNASSYPDVRFTYASDAVH